MQKQKYFRPYRKIIGKGQDQDFSHKKYNKQKPKKHFISQQLYFKNDDEEQGKQNYLNFKRKQNQKKRNVQVNHQQSQNLSFSPNKSYNNFSDYQDKKKSVKKFPYKKYDNKSNEYHPSKSYRNYDYNNKKSYLNNQETLVENLTNRNYGLPVWQHLYQQGLSALKQRYQYAQQPKVKIDIECTFKPKIKKSKRYLIPSNSTFLQRNQIWQDNKIQKIVKEKQEIVNKNLVDCTFRPSLNQKSKEINNNDKSNSKRKYNQYNNGQQKRILSQSFSQIPSQSQKEQNYKNKIKRRKQLKQIKVDFNSNSQDYQDNRFNNINNNKTKYKHNNNLNQNKKRRSHEKNQISTSNKNKTKSLVTAQVRNIIRNELKKIKL